MKASGCWCHSAKHVASGTRIARRVHDVEKRVRAQKRCGALAQTQRRVPPTRRSNRLAVCDPETGHSWALLTHRTNDQLRCSERRQRQRNEPKLDPANTLPGGQSYFGLIRPARPAERCFNQSFFKPTQSLIPTCIDYDPRAHWRRPMDMMRHG